MKLYLVQHAEARPAEEDPERSLSAIGMQNLERITSFLDEHGPIEPGRVFHSGKTRARQTAEFLAKHIGSSPVVEQTDGLEPMADPTIWSGRLRDLAADVMLVGHLPHLRKLAALLVAGEESIPVVTFHNAGLVCLVRDDSGAWSVDWVVPPEILK